MKVFITIACVLLSASVLDAKLTVSDVEGDDGDMTDCMLASKFTTDDYQRLASQQYDNPTESLKNYIKCMYEREGILKNGAINEAGIHKKYTNSAEEINAVIAKCRKIKGNNDADLAYKHHVCFTRANV